MKQVKSRCFPGGSAVKKLPANAGDSGSIPGSGRSPGEGNGYPLQCSCLENPRNRGAWQISSWGHKESEMTGQLSMHPFSGEGRRAGSRVNDRSYLYDEASIKIPIL